MRILYDHQAFTAQKYGGVSRCFVELYKNLPKGVDARISVQESDNIYLRDIINVRPNGYMFDHFICRHHFKGKWRLHVWSDQFRKHKYYPDYNTNCSIEQLKTGDFDIFHPTFFNDYFLPYLNGKPFVLTIHDMIPELYPQYFSSNDSQIVMKRKLAPLASAIIAVSENTKKDVIRILGVSEEKVHVVYHGCSLLTKLKGERRPFPYILYIGARWGYKNFTPFVNSIVPILKRYKDLHVICTGTPFNNVEKKLLVELGVDSRFIHQWIENDSDLYTLYHYALCFVYPSDYEGFGIPILEAYQADCPVLLNKRSCFPEIAGEAACYFEISKERNDLAEKVETILKMKPTEKESLLFKQRQRLSLFSWQHSAEKMIQVYHSILGEGYENIEH